MVLEKTLESPLDCKEIQPVHAESFEKTLLLGKSEGKRRRGPQRMNWLDGITDSVETNLSKFQEIVKDKEASSAFVHRVAKSGAQLSG